MLKTTPHLVLKTTPHLVLKTTPPLVVSYKVIFSITWHLTLVFLPHRFVNGLIGEWFLFLSQKKSPVKKAPVILNSLQERCFSSCITRPTCVCIISIHLFFMYRGVHNYWNDFKRLLQGYGWSDKKFFLSKNTFLVKNF